MKRLAWLWLLALPAMFVVAAAHGQQPIPGITAYVNDQTGTLSGAEREALERRLQALERRKGAQVAVLIVATTAPEAIEQYSLRAAEAWKLGRKGTDDGVLLVVARNDRRLRLEVGYGLEGAIPDAIAKRVISEIIVPRFQQGDFGGGIVTGLEQVEKLIEGETLPPPKASVGAAGLDALMQWLPLLLVMTIMLGAITRAMFGRVGGAAVTGGIVGTTGWIITSALALGLGVGLLVFLLSMFAEAGTGGGRWSNRGGYSPGGGSWGGGGSSGGGFGGGGGGSFGGGGASGSW
jgi:uncharacterized protein